MFNYLNKYLEYKLWDIQIGRIVAFVIVFSLLYFSRYIILKWGVKFAEKIASKTKNNYDNTIIENLKPPFKFFLLILFFSISLNILILSPYLKILLSQINRSLIIISIFWGLYRIVYSISFVILNDKEKNELNKRIVLFSSKIIYIVIILLCTITIIREWKYDVTAIVTGLGVGGLAFALAAQDTLANIFSLFMLIADKTFSIGDWIETSSFEGSVEDIGFRSTKIRTLSDAVITIPNSVLANNLITNWSKRTKRIINFNLGLTYSTKPEQMREFTKKAEEYLNKDEDVIKDTIIVKFTDFKDSSLDVFFYFGVKYVTWIEFHTIQERIKMDIFEMVNEYGLSCAFPTRTIHIEK